MFDTLMMMVMLLLLLLMLLLDVAITVVTHDMRIDFSRSLFISSSRSMCINKAPE